MHEEAELGVAAHAVYADSKSSKTASNDEISLLKQLADWQEELTEGIPLEQLKLDVFADRLFVFSPKGALHRLPKDATAVDFAYSVHTEVGNTCRGAKVNGVLVGLDYKLQNGDVVEILTQQRKQPSLDWLRFVKTGHARNAIRSFYRQRDRETHIEVGKGLLHEAAKRRGQEMDDESIKLALGRLAGVRTAEELFAKVGSGLLAADSVFADEQRPQPRKHPVTPRKRQPHGVSLTGIHSLATRRAKCCNPRPPAKIVGYVTVGAGITIHRETCSQIQHPPDPSRLLPVDWEEAAR
jgi:GTP pyrophosphokinase